MRRVLQAVLFCVASTAGVNAAEMLPVPAALLLSQANALFRAGHYDAALISTHSLLQVVPERGDVWLQLGFVYGKLGCTRDKLAAFEKAVALNPNSGAARSALRLARVLAGQGGHFGGIIVNAMPVSF